MSDESRCIKHIPTFHKKKNYKIIYIRMRFTTLAIANVDALQRIKIFAVKNMSIPHSQI